MSESLPVPHWLRSLECKIEEVAKILEAVETPAWALRLEEKINLVLDLEGVIITDQETLDADVAKLVALENAIAAEIAALKAQPAAAAVDFSGLDTVIGTFGTLVPAAPVDVPVDVPVEVPAPVDVPPVDTAVASA